MSAVELAKLADVREVVNLQIRRSRHPRLGWHHAHDGTLFRGRYSHIQLGDHGVRGREGDAGVVLPAFDSGIEWFSMIWGDHADDMLALEIDERVTGPLPKVSHVGTRPLGQFVDAIREYQLAGPVTERLKLELVDPHDYRIGEPRGVLREVQFHDHCFWSVRPIDEPTLRALAAQQLALHEEYLECPGGLSPYLEPLCELQRTGEELHLKSLPAGKLRVSFGSRRPLGGRSSTWWPIPND